jgi:hypothetical protein
MFEPVQPHGLFNSPANQDSYIQVLTGNMSEDRPKIQKRVFDGNIASPDGLFHDEVMAGGSCLTNVNWGNS